MTIGQRLSVIFLSCCWGALGKKTTSLLDRSYQLANIPQGLQYYASASPGLIYPNLPATIFIPGQVGSPNLPTGIPSTLPTTESPPSFISSPFYSSYPQQQQGAASYSIEQSVDLTESKPLPPVGSTYGPPKTVDVAFRRPHTHGSSNHHRTYQRFKGHPYASRGGRPSSRPLVYSHVHKGHLHTHYVPPSVPGYKSQKPTYLPPQTTTQSPLSSTESPLQLVYNHHAHPTNAGKTSSSSSAGNLVRFPGGSSQGDITQAVIGQQGIINNYDANLPIKIPKPKPHQLQVKEILQNAELHFVDVLENKPTTASPVPQTSYQSYQHEAHRQQAYQQLQQLYQQQQQSYQPPQQGFQQNFGAFPISQIYQPQQQQQEDPAPITFTFHQDNQQHQNQQQQIRPYAELYDHRFQVSQSLQNNHLEQDSGSSETLKVPVAVFKGVVPSGMFSLPVERSDETDSSDSTPPDFSPSKSTSDWIPVTGGASLPKPEKIRNLNQFGDDYFADLGMKSSTFEESKISQPSKKSHESFFIEPSASNGHQNFPIAEKLTGNVEEPIYGSTPSFKKTNFRSDFKKNEKVGDIISGRIPGDHNPFGTLGGERDRRKSNLGEGSSTSSGNIGDGSNLVVSSVIKFSR